MTGLLQFFTLQILARRITPDKKEMILLWAMAWPIQESDI